ncbi:unnamed protein product [Tilletia laevis]|uniref:Uncharacterized protein n=2 Tax=Tilletia TaxID=13289 RepID=A0A8X7MQ56_9BASI|nr:hypothetical protein CF336_g5485 [Tilletia laevis]KAE8193303.1 hypothetical protein CF328_g5087 [Tilletia controversa]KAE8257372.1 hypothetical protein A4X03_0g4690 [Tilletia caries]KAE8196980.1 hypothetical protein CF335_g4723 [Tilletia laevis]KAE8244155.1 hypothetical protein A4X06_0g5953 [Tilletia controversa]
MLSFLKIRGSLLALALLAIQVLAVAASPLASNVEELSPALLTRARGKYVGSRCTTDSECFSLNCARTNGTSKLTCQRQPAGGKCATNVNCVSRQCDGTTRTCALSELLGKCSSKGDCDTSQSDVDCVNGVCLLQEGGRCSSDTSCASGHCIDHTCRTPPLAPYVFCDEDSDCLSKSCVFLDPRQCRNLDGSYTGCAYSELSYACAGYPLGHSCASNVECSVGTCKSGVCSESQVGDQCLEQYQCTGGALCGSDNKCYRPANGTLSPTTMCNSNATCTSGRCVDVIRNKDTQGVNSLFDTYVPAPVCDYLKNGQTGCKSFKDCSTGLCKDGTCEPGKEDDRCIVNYMCDAGFVCGTDGVCSKPAPASLSFGDVCSNATQCVSGVCDSSLRQSIGRPSFDNTQTVYHVDPTCQGSNTGGACKVQDDCYDGQCVNGVCSLSPLGGYCQRLGDCISQQCDGPSNACVLTSGFGTCSSDEGCFSGDCVESSYCIGGGGCDFPPRCAYVPLGGKCRYGSDCDRFGEGADCGTAGLCVVA